MFVPVYIIIVTPVDILIALNHWYKVCSTLRSFKIWFHRGKNLSKENQSRLCSRNGSLSCIKGLPVIVYSILQEFQSCFVLQINSVLCHVFFSNVTRMFAKIGHVLPFLLYIDVFVIVIRVTLNSEFRNWQFYK